MQQKVKVFVSYAHEDDKLREQLDRHLSLLKRNNFIDIWHDRKVSPGHDWKQEIDAHLNDAQIILLLVSADFLASDYCSGIEMERALQKHQEGSARVIPVILRPVDWEDAPFNNLQALPTEGEPVTNWPGEFGRDNAFRNVAIGIRKAMNELRAIQWYLEGDALYNAKHYEEALTSFRRAIELDPNKAQFYKSSGEALSKLGAGRYEEALDAFEQTTRLDPQDAVAYNYQGWLFNELKRYDEALRACQQAIQLDSKSAVAYRHKGWALFELIRYEEALNAFEHSIHLGCTPADPYYDIVRGLNALGVIKISPLQHGSTQDSKGQYWHYPEMSVYWSPETGIHALIGPIRDKWESLDSEHGILGYPTTDVEYLPDRVGRHCHFQHGCIYWSPDTGAQEVHGLIQDKWASLGWEQSFLGYPIADEKGSPDGIGRISNFQHGSIYWTPQTEAHEAHGEIRDKWESLHWELGPLGYPLSDQEPTADGVGCYQHFQGGSIFWSSDIGAHEVDGLIRDKWESLDWERGVLGYPTTDVMGLPDGIGRHCHFQYGSIYWSPTTGTHEVHGFIRDKWAGLEWERGFLGYPVSDEMGTRDKIGAQSHFQHGSIYWTPTTGAHEVHGIIREKWFSLDKNYGVLKYPISDQEPTADKIGYYQHFQGGSIFGSPDTGVHEIYGAIWAKWKQLEWERSILGYPTTGELGTPDGVGRYSHFQHGSIYYTAETNAHEVHGLIWKKWGSLGWEQSSLGYPIRDEMQASDEIGRISYFQYGAIYLSDVQDTVVLKGRGQDLRERFRDPQKFALALEQARKPVSTALTAVIYHIDHPPEKNCGYYRIGKNLDANGITAGGWSKPRQLGLKAKEHQGAGIALVDLDGSGCPDMLIFRIDHSEEKGSRGFYRVGKNLHIDGIATDDWCKAIPIPEPFGKQNLGAGIAIADLDRSGRPDLLVFYFDCSDHEKQGFYHVGRNLDSSGQVTGDWSEPIHVPGGFGSEKYCIGIALADLDGNARPDLIIFYIERQEEENHGYYRVGKHLDSNGIVTGGWSEPIQVPGSFGKQNHGASIALADLNKNGRADLVIFYIEHPEGENRGYYRIGRNLDANGCATGGWTEPIQVPGWFGTQNQGAGIAITTLL